MSGTIGFYDDNLFDLNNNGIFYLCEQGYIFGDNEV